MISAPEMLQLLQHECETLRRRAPAVDSIAVPRELLETVLEDLISADAAGDFHGAVSNPETIDRLKALLAEGRAG